MKKTIKFPMLIGPNGNYTTYGFGDKDGDGDVDVGLLWDNTENWDCPETAIKRVDVEIEVDFPDGSVETIKGEIKE